MKKIIYIILFVAIISLISISELKADEVDNYYTYVKSFEHCGFIGTSFNTGLAGNVDIYLINENVPNYFSITLLTGNNLVALARTDLLDSCVNGQSGFSNWSTINQRNVSPGTYTSNITIPISKPYYLYVWSGYVQTNNGYVPGTTNWGTNAPAPAPAPTIPEVEIPDTDFYLFFDFNTIADFNVFSSYDFTSFTDYEKLSFTILINIFYLGFIGFCIYLLAKGLYKMLSWVFR